MSVSLRNSLWGPLKAVQTVSCGRQCQDSRQSLWQRM